MKLIKVLKSKKTIERIKKMNDEWEEEIKARRASFLNEEIAELYNIRLIQCGRCSTLLTIDVSHEGDCKCKACGFEDDECSFPDFFY